MSILFSGTREALLGGPIPGVAGALDCELEMALALGADVVYNTLGATSKYCTADIARSVGDLTGGEMADRAIVPMDEPIIHRFPLDKPEDAIRLIDDASVSNKIKAVIEI